MANCIRCGRPAKEGEKLCAACSRQEQGPRLPKSILVTLIVLSLVTIGALAVIVAQLLNAHSQRVSLRLREEALDAREKEYAAVQAELEETEDALSEAKQTPQPMAVPCIFRETSRRSSRGRRRYPRCKAASPRRKAKAHRASMI